MKTGTNIISISTAEIADLLGKAFSCSMWLAFQPAEGAADRVDLSGIDSAPEQWAAILQAGLPLEAIDVDANYLLHGNLPLKGLNEDGEAKYTFFLQDLISGLVAAADGNVAPGLTPGEISLAAESFCHFRNGDLDESDAERLMQVVLFREIVY